LLVESQNLACEISRRASARKTRARLDSAALRGRNYAICYASTVQAPHSIAQGLRSTAPASSKGRAAGGCVHAIKSSTKRSYTTYRCWTLQQHNAGPWSHHAVAVPLRTPKSNKAKSGGESPAARRCSRARRAMVASLWMRWLLACWGLTARAAGSNTEGAKAVSQPRPCCSAACSLQMCLCCYGNAQTTVTYILMQLCRLPQSVYCENRLQAFCSCSRQHLQ
jgi:hypothetical protein